MNKKATNYNNMESDPSLPQGEQIKLTSEEKTLLDVVPDEYDPIVGTDTFVGGADEVVSFNVFDVTHGVDPALQAQLNSLQQKCFQADFAVVRTISLVPQYAGRQATQSVVAYIVNSDNQIRAHMFINILQVGTTYHYEIWSVCKDPNYLGKNAFAAMLHTFARTVVLPSTRDAMFYLVASRENTSVMSEYGRLKMYAKLGFRIMPGQIVKFYGKFPVYVAGHSALDNVTISLGQPGQTKNVYFNSIQSWETDIRMQATLQDVEAAFNAPPTFLIDEYDRTNQRLAVFNDGVRSTAVTIQTNMYADGTIRSGVDYGRNVDYFQIASHMEYRQANNGLLETMTVPDNHICVVLHTPGSALMMSSGVIGTMTRALMNEFSTFDSRVNFCKRFTGYSTFPLHGTPWELTAEALATEMAKPSDDGNLFSHSGLYAAFVQQFERRPILTRCLLSDDIQAAISPYYAVPSNSGIKQSQLEFQVYLPGQTMLKSYLARQTNYGSDGRPIKPELVEQNKDDKGFGIGTMGIKSINPVDYSTTPHRYDDDFVTTGTEPLKFRGLDKYITRMNEAAPVAVGRKRVIFLFGCGAVPVRNYDIQMVQDPTGAMVPKISARDEQFYEMSHKRSAVHYMLDSPYFGEFHQDNLVFNQQFRDYAQGRLPLKPKYSSCTDLLHRLRTMYDSRPAAEKRLITTLYTGWFIRGAYNALSPFDPAPLPTFESMWLEHAAQLMVQLASQSPITSATLTQIFSYINSVNPVGLTGYDIGILRRSLWACAIEELLFRWVNTQIQRLPPANIELYKQTLSASLSNLQVDMRILPFYAPLYAYVSTLTGQEWRDIYRRVICSALYLLLNGPIALHQQLDLPTVAPIGPMAGGKTYRRKRRVTRKHKTYRRKQPSSQKKKAIV